MQQVRKEQRVQAARALPEKEAPAAGARRAQARCYCRIRLARPTIRLPRHMKRISVSGLALCDLSLCAALQQGPAAPKK